MAKRQYRTNKEPYDAPRIFFDSFETYDFQPSKEEREAFRNLRTAKGRQNWLKARQERWEREHAEWLKKRHAQIMADVEKDKVLIAMERAFAQHVQQIQDYYKAAHAKERG